MAQSKGTDVVIQLLDQALKVGLTAKYVMFDTWFSKPHQIVQISQRGLNVIAMVKKSSKITYEFEGKRMNVKQIFNACKKRRGRSRYLLSVPVKVGDPAKDSAQIDARIVCVRNRSNRKDWIALICTDMTIDENEIIRIYGKRWDIEVFFKTCKSFLKFGTEYHGLSYATNPGGSHVRESERDLPTDRRADGKVHQRFHFTPPEVHARGYIAITSSLIEYLLAKLLSFQGFIVLFGMGSLNIN